MKRIMKKQYLGIALGVLLALPLVAQADDKAPPPAAPAAAAPGMAPGGGMMMRQGGGQGKGWRKAMRFDAIDSNNDGTISKEEHRAWSDANFDRMDANHDGTVSKNEFATFHGGQRK